jgi:ABC-2 type transport system permease protein
MRLRVISAVARATAREFWRTPEAVFWSFVFPLAMALVLGFAFRQERREQVRVLIEAASVEQLPSLAELRGDPRLDVQVAEPAVAERALMLGTAALVLRVTPSGVEMVLDRTRPDSEVAELLVLRRLQEGAGRQDPVAVAPRSVESPGSRYIDFLIAGLVGLNLMGMGLFGIGFNLVYMRVRRTLRRLAVTPMGRGEFFAGFLLTRLVLAVPAAVVIIGFGQLVFGVPMRGSWLAALAVIVAGGLAFSGVGALVASRVTTIEGAGGLMNIVQLPMWLLGGVFFSNQRFPPLVQPLIDALPMSALTDGLRRVMLEAEGLGGVAVPVAVLSGLGVATLALAINIFRWN